MSSYKKRQKTLKRRHKERAQVGSRQHLGLLEKHKDYVLRARDYQKKKAQLKLMHEKARNRNPDEFYYKMIKTKLKGGRHVMPQDAEDYSTEELQLMKTQDDKYIQMKLASETKKVERLKSCLHRTELVKSNPQNSHTIFVDSMEEASAYAEKCKERHKRKRRKKREVQVGQVVGGGGSGEADGEDQGSYKVLKQRMKRCQELQKVSLKMKTQKDLMGKGRCVKVKGDGSHPPVYKWKQERQK